MCVVRLIISVAYIVRLKSYVLYTSYKLYTRLDRRVSEVQECQHFVKTLIDVAINNTSWDILI